MSEYNKIQYSTFVNGDQIVIRADDALEFKKLVKDMAEESEASLKAINALKQAHVAAGVFTGDGTKKGATTGGSTTATKKRAKDAPPPSSDGDDVEVPECDHGPMLDLRDRDYKSDFYCSLDTRDWKKKCKPVKVD